MKAIFSFFILFFTLTQSFSQLIDDFSDQNINENPVWQGDTDKFTVNNGELQLFDQSPEANNVAFLAVPALTSTDAATTWEFLFRMEFNPSGSNWTRVYLSASESDLSGDLEGYYLQAGSGGSDDALELYRQDGNSSVLLSSGAPGAVSVAPATARVRVIRSMDGEWSVYADYSGGTDLELDGSATDNTYPMGNFFGFYCRYTSTRNEDFFFDDMLVDPLYEDQEAPVLMDASTEDANTLTLTFNENLDETSAETVTNYSINNGIGTPSSATLDAQNPSKVTLTTATPFINQSSYEITVTNIQDPAGNILAGQSLLFAFLDVQQPMVNEILITEIMADISPEPSGLPEAEYIEIFNHSEKVFQLGDLQLAFNGSEKDLPEYLLLPGQYVIICDDAFAPAFEPFGSTLFLGTFPQLTNGSGQLQIIDQNDVVIFEVNYTDTWYADEMKAAGGWSLEMINLESIYDCGGNWVAAEHPDGGTPGSENSVFGVPLETTGPLLRSAFPESSFEVLVTFDKAVDPATVSPETFTISEGITIFNATVQEPETNTVLVTLSVPLSTGIVYFLEAASAIADCLGNTLESSEVVYFGLPEAMAPGDIVINEILFNPETFGSDFLEVYNKSDKIFDLDDITLVNFLKEDTTFIRRHLLFPGEYAVITEVPQDIRDRYTVAFPDRIFYSDIPSFDDKAGNVTIKFNGITIDSFDYNEDMHFGLLSDINGISLERLSPDIPTQSFGNWHSAAAAVGYATPTYKNSQFSVPVEAGSSILSIANTTFSPDDDGYEDILLINYATDTPGFFINLYVYDALGRPVKQLATNELLASQGVFKWDGTNDEGQKARLGIYVIWAELFTTEGTVEQFKETCVLAGQLD
jgi:hypothetical protein